MTAAQNPVLAYRNLAAEVRAVEEGHQARLAADGRSFRIVSDTRPGVVYSVCPFATDTEVGWECDCPAGRSRIVWSGAPCKHAARVAERLVREGLVRWAGDRWVPTGRALALAAPVDTAKLLGRFL